MKSEPPYYAVIFTSRLAVDTDGYDDMAAKMEALAAGQPGFLGIESARDADGLGITVSYWATRDDIERWRGNIEHRAAQDQGNRRWYAHYDIRIARVERTRDRPARDDGWPGTLQARIIDPRNESTNKRTTNRGTP